MRLTKQQSSLFIKSQYTCFPSCSCLFRRCRVPTTWWRNINQTRSPFSLRSRPWKRSMLVLLKSYISPSRRRKPLKRFVLLFIMSSPRYHRFVSLTGRFTTDISLVIHGFIPITTINTFYWSVWLVLSLVSTLVIIGIKLRNILNWQQLCSILIPSI